MSTVRTPLFANDTSPRSDLFIALLLGLAALALSAYGIGSKSFWMDEALTLNATHSWADFPRRIMELHGGSWLYYLTFLPWRMWAESEWQLRLFSALFASGTAVLVYLAGRRLVDRTTGIIAALLLASHPLFVQHGQDNRVYTMLLFLVVAHGIVLLRALETGSWQTWLGFSVLGMLSFSAHYFSILAFGAQAGAAILLWPKRIRWLRALISGGLYLCFVAGSVLFFGSLDASEGLNFLGLPWWNEIRLMAIGLAGGGRPAWVAFYAISILLVVLWAAGLIRRRTAGNDEVRKFLWLLAWVVAPPAGMLAFSYLVSPAFIPRYAISALPAGALLLAMAARGVRPATLSAVLLVAIAATQLMGLKDWYARNGIEDWRGAGQYFTENAKDTEGAVIFRYYAEAPFRFYVDRGRERRTGTPWALPGTDWVYWWNHDTGQVIPMRELRSELAGSDSFWLVLAHDDLEFADGKRTRDALMSLLDSYQLEQERKFRQVWIGRYVRR